MRNFNQGSDNRGGGPARRSFGGGGSRFGGGSGRPSDRGPVTMHQAICSTCGKSCEVPFRPTGDKPIYCNDCFSANRGSDRGGDRGGDRFPRKEFGSRPPMQSFSANRGGGNDEVKKQLEFLGLKIDRLTKVVEGLVSPKLVSKEKNIEVSEALQDMAVIKKTKTKAPVKKVSKKVKV
ncbi:MAG: hypothetical protein NT041_02385 [Candidatus Vogelbacteria bacterium]|nr:hypothetical protein [Candidatus Vogelbacteria bacterium]